MEQMVTAGGEKHGMMRTLPNSNPPNKYGHLQDPHKTEMQKRHKKAMELVDVEYINLTNQENGRFEASYGASFPGEPIRMFKCISGHRYVIPRGLMEQVNEELGYHKRSGLIDTDGKELVNDSAKKIQTHRFIYLGDHK